jgi:hypothetical protein
MRLASVKHGLAQSGLFVVSDSLSGLFLLNTLINFFAMNRDILGRIHTNANLIAFDAEHGHIDLVADHQRLPDSSGKNEHA